MAIAASAVAAQAQVQFFFDEYEWRTAVSEVEGLNTCAANVALAEEVTPPLEPNTHLCGWPPISDCMLTFGAMDTGLSRSFELEPLQEEPSLSAGLTFDDNEGPTSAWDAAISIGDIDNSEDDDFEIRITSGPDLTAIGFYLVHSSSTAGESLEVFGESDTLLATLDGLSIPSSSDRQFVGVVSVEAITRVKFEEDPDGDDIALRDFRFALRDSPFGIDPSGTWTETDPITGTRGFHTATLLPSGKVLIAGGESGNSPLNIADLYDPATGTFEPTGALNHARSEHTATLLPSGKVLVVGGQGTSGSNVSLASVEIYDPETGEWAEGPSLDQGRRAHTATLLASGKVLVAGGDAKTVGNPLRCDTTETLNTAKVYDPTPPGTWEGALTMTESRRSHTATLLPDGKVLIAGGNNVTGSFWCNQLTSAEIYNPATSAVTAVVDHMDTGRHLHTATLLPSGKVLLAGGTETSSSDGITKTELFDVGTETFTDGSDLFHRHNLHSATLLPSGQVLVAGGGRANSHAKVEIYDPDTTEWRLAPDMVAAPVGVPGEEGRSRHTATLLPSGGVLVAGGMAGNSVNLRTAEVFRLSAAAIGTAAPLDVARGKHTATLLPNGEVLVAGGCASLENGSLIECDPADQPESTRLYSRFDNAWRNAANLKLEREDHTATLLPNDDNEPFRVLVAGGKNDSGYLASVEIYEPGPDTSDPGTWTEAAPLDSERSGHTATLLPSGRVLIAAGRNSAGLVASAEVFDPGTGEWASASGLQDARRRHTATLLTSGKVLVTGGEGAEDTSLSSVEVYDPAADSWTFAAPLLDGRRDHTATLLPSGKVLVAGGGRLVGGLPTVELYDPVADAWEYAADGEIRGNHTATLLADGRVLVYGRKGGCIGLLPQIYDPATDAWSDLVSGEVGRIHHTATLLPSGEVLLAGGMEGKGAEALASVTLFDPWSDPQLPSGRRPVITSPQTPTPTMPPATIDYVNRIDVSGTGLGGDSEASGGGTRNSAVDFPLVQLRAVEGEISAWLVPEPRPNFSDDPMTLMLSEMPPIFNPGWHLLTVVTAGVPSESQLVEFECSLGITGPVCSDPGGLCGPADVTIDLDSCQPPNPGPCTATFSIETAGARRFRWQECFGTAAACADDGSGWIDIPGATAPGYTTPLISGPDSGTRYRVVADSGCMTKASDAAVLTVEDEERPIAEVVSPSGGEFWPLSESGATPNTRVVSWSMSDNIRACRVRVSLLFSHNGMPYQEAEELYLEDNFDLDDTCVETVGTSNVSYQVPESPPSGNSGSLYKIQVEVTDHVGLTACLDPTTGEPVTDPAAACDPVRSPNPFFIVEADDDSVRTLILAHTARMENPQIMGISAAEKAALDAQLQLLTDPALTTVQGRVIDLGAVPELAGLYADWDDGTVSANEVLFGDPNATAGTIRHGGIHGYLLNQLLPIFTGVKYLVLVGDDRIIPMARLDDRTSLLPESSYPAGDELTADTTVGQALANDRYLSDDPLSVLDPVELDPVAPEELANLFVPDLAVGRLVEEPGEIITTIATFISKSGTLDLSAASNQNHQVLITGYDFLVDSANTIHRRWRSILDPSADEVDGELVGRTWPGIDARQELLDRLGGQVAGCNDCARFGVMSLSGHATHFEAGVPGTSPHHITGLETCAIATNDLSCPADPDPETLLDLAGGVIYAVGCHSGLPVTPSICQDDDLVGCDGQNPCDDVTNPPCDRDHSLDLPQTFLGRGALAYVGNTGYGYGFPAGIAYGERLVEILTERLAVAGTTAVGDAVVATKQQYFQEIQTLNAYDHKSLMQWTFYGLPMVELTVPQDSSGRGAAPPPPFSGPAPAAEELAAEEQLGAVTVRRKLSGAGAAGPAAAPARVPLPDFLTRLDLHFEFGGSVYLKRTAAGEICCPDPDGPDGPIEPDHCPGIADGPDCPGGVCPPGFTGCAQDVGCDWRTPEGDVCCPDGDCPGDDDCDEDDVCPEGSAVCENGCYYTLNNLVERASGVVDVPLQPYLLFDSRLAGTSQHGVLWKGGVYEEESGWKPVFAQVVSNEAEENQADDPGVLPQVSTICPAAPRLVPGRDSADCRPSDTELNSLVINAGEAVDSDGADGDPNDPDDDDGKLEYDLERHYLDIDLEAFYFNNTVNPANNCDRAGPVIEQVDGDYHSVDGTTLEWTVPASDAEGEVWRVIVVWDDGTERCGENLDQRCWTPVELEDAPVANRPECGNGTFCGSAVVAAESPVNYMLQAVDTRGNVSALPFRITDPTGAPCSCGGEPPGLDPCPVTDPPICAESGVVPQLPRVVGARAGSEADLSIVKVASNDPVTAGTQLTYTIIVTNHGPSVAEGVIVTDDLPDGLADAVSSACDVDGGVATCDLRTIEASGSQQVEITATVDSATTGSLINTAEVDATTVDAATGNNQAEVTTTVATSADLEVSLAAPPTVLAGGELAYALTVDNLGPSDATGVQVSAILPPELSSAASAGCANDPNGFPACDLETVATGSPASFVLTAIVDSAATGDLFAAASVLAAVTDPVATNNTATATTAVDLVAPTVLGTGSIDDTGDGVLADCETTRARISHLLLAFSEAMQDPAGDDGPDDVTNPGNFSLLAAGPDRDFSTGACGPALGDDAEIAITAVAWDPATLTATLDLGRTGLTDDLYRLLACGSTTLRDLAGHPLDGDADGEPGGDFSLIFRTDRENHFTGGRFDCSLDGWTAASTAPGEIAHSPEDADDSSVSGSARFTNLSGGTAYALGQCLPAATGDLTLSARWRLDAAPLVTLRLAQGCEHYGQPICAGAALSSSVLQADLADTGGLWQELEHAVATPAGAVSALCSFDVERHGDPDFSLFLDDAVLSGEIFADGFESGNTLSWSATTPP